MKNKSYLLIIAVLFGLILNSCDPVKRLERLKMKICPLCITGSKDSTSSKDSTGITYRDTVFNWPPVFDTMAFVEKLSLNNGKCTLPIKTFSDGFIQAQAWAIDGNLYLKAWLKNNPLQVRLEDAIKQIDHYKTTISTKTITIEIPKEIPVAYVPKFYKWLLWINIGLVVIGGIIGYFKLKTNILKGVK